MSGGPCREVEIMLSLRYRCLLPLLILCGAAACSHSTSKVTPTPEATVVPGTSPTNETSPTEPAARTATPRPRAPTPARPTTPAPTPSLRHADVLAVNATGDPGAYTFAVTLHSPDTGCDNYADWWEVLDEDGTLLYRRILNHSHVDEQPFTRTGGPVPVQADQKVIVRGHVNTTGYGGRAMSGTVSSGFTYDPTIGADFASDVAQQDPQPTGCAF